MTAALHSLRSLYDTCIQRTCHSFVSPLNRDMAVTSALHSLRLLYDTLFVDSDMVLRPRTYHSFASLRNRNITVTAALHSFTLLYDTLCSSIQYFSLICNLGILKYCIWPRGMMLFALILRLRGNSKSVRRSVTISSQVWLVVQTFKRSKLARDGKAANSQVPPSLVLD